MALDQGSTKAIVDRVIAAAKKVAGGSSGAEVSCMVTSGRSANTRFAQNQITSTGDVDETRVSVTIAHGKRSATTSSNQIDPAAVTALVERADRMAKLAPEDPEHMPLLKAQKYLKVPAAYDAKTEKLPADARAKAAEAAIAAGAADKLGIAGFYEHGGASTAIGNSAGLYAWHESTDVSLTMTARTADGTGSGWAGAYATKASDVDAAKLAAVATRKAIASAGTPQRVDPGRYEVVLEPAAVAELLDFLTGALDARRADEGRSFFSKAGGGTKLGDKLFGDTITLRSDPTDALNPGAPFAGDGLAYAAQTWIDKGKIAGLTYGRFWADKQKKAPTGHPGVWSLAGGTAANVDELVAGVKQGVLITRFWYTRWVDPQTILITGLTRDGTFVIKDGKLAGPTTNFRFNESPVTMLANAVAMTKDPVRIGGFRVPAIRCTGFNLASVSEAV